MEQGEASSSLVSVALFLARKQEGQELLLEPRLTGILECEVTAILVMVMMVVMMVVMVVVMVVVVCVCAAAAGGSG